MPKPFLILQLRPETEASDNEFEAFLDKSRLPADRVRRVRLDQAPHPEELDLADYAGVIVGGGPGCVSNPPDRKSAIEKRIEDAALAVVSEAVAKDSPFLGCCYGIGILARHLGGGVSMERFSEEVGVSTCALTEEGRADPLLEGLPDEFDAFVGHKEAVQELPDGCAHLLASTPCPFQMIRCGSNVYATQFHPEADPDGFHLRIDIYKDYGYFPPEDAARLHEIVDGADVHAPMRILENFAARYG